MHGLQICTQLSKYIGDELNTQNVGTKYFTDIFNNVFTKSFLAGDVPICPLVSVTPGPETYKYEPSGVRWTLQVMYIRGYIKSELEQEQQLLLLMGDLKKVLDAPEKIKYIISNPDGSQEDRFVTISNLNELTTDEGILRPLAIGELSISVQYCEDGRIF